MKLDRKFKFLFKRCCVSKRNIYAKLHENRSSKMILSQVDGGSFLTLREKCFILSFREGGGRLDWKLRDLEGKDELGLVPWL